MDKQMIEKLTEEEIWLLETMVRQMDVLVNQMYFSVDDLQHYSSIWHELKEKLGFGDIK